MGESGFLARNNDLVYNEHVLLMSRDPMCAPTSLFVECGTIRPSSAVLSPKSFDRKNVLVISSQVIAMKEMSTTRDRMTDAAVARVLYVSRRTLLRWLKDGVVDAPVLTVGRRASRRWAEHEVAHILAQMKRGGLRDSTSDIEPTRRGGEDNHRRYFGKVLRRQRQESIAD